MQPGAELYCLTGGRRREPIARVRLQYALAGGELWYVRALDAASDDHGRWYCAEFVVSLIRSLD